MIDEKCAVCKGPAAPKYVPMKSWNIAGAMCGKCYSKRLGEHYPRDHVRVNVDKK